MTALPWLYGRRGQALAAALALLLLCAAWFGVVAPARSWFQHRGEWLDQRRQVLRHMRMVASDVPRLRQVFGTMAETDLDAGQLAGPTDAVAAALLQDSLGMIARSSGIILTTVETPPPLAADPWHRVGLRIAFSAPWSRLVAFLRQVGTLPVRVFVDDLHLSSDATGLTPVQASMLVYGFRPVRRFSARQDPSSD